MVKRLLCSLLVSILFLNFSFADENHEGGNFGEGKAILDVTENGYKFKLSERAIKTIKLKIQVISPLGENTFRVPKSSLISFGEQFGVFVVRNGWFEIVEIKVKNRKNNAINIISRKLSKSDQIVVSGVPLLRIAQLEASGEGGEGHGH